MTGSDIRGVLSRLGGFRKRTTGFALLLDLLIPTLALETGILLAFRWGVVGATAPVGVIPLFLLPLLLPAVGFFAVILRKTSPEETAIELERSLGIPQVLSTYLELARNEPEHPFLPRLRGEASVFLGRISEEFPRDFRVPRILRRHTAIPVLTAVFVLLAVLPLSVFEPAPSIAAEGEVLEELAERLAAGEGSSVPEQGDLIDRLEKLGRDLQERRTDPERAAERIEQLARNLEELKRGYDRAGGTGRETTVPGPGSGERIDLEDTVSVREKLLAGAERLADLSRTEPLDPDSIDPKDRLQAPPAETGREESEGDREERAADDSLPGRGYLPPSKNSQEDSESSGGEEGESGPGSAGGESPGSPVPGAPGSPRSDSDAGPGTDLPGEGSGGRKDESERISRIEGDPLPGESLTGFIRGLGTGRTDDWTGNGEVLESYRKLAESDIQNRGIPERYRSVVRDYMLEIGVFNE